MDGGKDEAFDKYDMSSFSWQGVKGILLPRRPISEAFHRQMLDEAFLDV